MNLMGNEEDQTLSKRTKKDRGIWKHDAVLKDELDKQTADRRVERAKELLAERPNPEIGKTFYSLMSVIFSGGFKGRSILFEKLGRDMTLRISIIVLDGQKKTKYHVSMFGRLLVITSSRHLSFMMLGTRMGR